MKGFVSFALLIALSSCGASTNNHHNSRQETPKQTAAWNKLQRDRKLQGAVANNGDYNIRHTDISTSYWTTTNRTRYYCTFRNLWTPERHPQDYPTDARWSPASIYSHTMNYQPWKVNQRVSLGIEDIVERGYTEKFQEEIEVAGEQCYDYESSGGTGFYTNNQEGVFVHLPGIDVNYNYPYLSTIIAMSPSPDWFTGFYDFFVIDDYQKLYFDRFIIQTFPLDGGTDKAETYTAEHDFQDPPKAVERISWANSPNGIYLNPEQSEVLPVGEWDCLLHTGPTDLERPDCDFLKNPNCGVPVCRTSSYSGPECSVCDETMAALGECVEEEESGAATVVTSMAVAVMTMVGFLML